MFPGLGGILGQTNWERLLEEYLERHPPTSFLLRDLGDRLAGFVEQSDWLPERELCADMARLEWSYVEVFDAADTPPLDPAELAKIPEHAWEHAQVELAPAIQLLAVGHPVADLRRQIRAGHEPRSPLPGASSSFTASEALRRGERRRVSPVCAQRTPPAPLARTRSRKHRQPPGSKPASARGFGTGGAWLIGREAGDGRAASIGRSAYPAV
jgi:hypothetical protein